MRHEWNGKRDVALFSRRYKGIFLMISEGQIVLFRFPQTEQQSGKLRPALVVRKLPGRYEDWLVCMISSQLNQEVTGFDETISPEDMVKRCRISRTQSSHYL